MSEAFSGKPGALKRPEASGIPHVSKNHLTALKRVAMVGLAGLAARGAFAIHNDVSSVDNDPAPIVAQVAAAPVSTRGLPESISLTDPSSIERFNKQKEIEGKYGIQLITLPEAYKIIGKDYNPLDLSQVPSEVATRWEEEDLQLYGDLFSFLPDSLYKPINGVGTKVFRGDIGETDCACAGSSYGKSGVIGMETKVGIGDRWGTFTVLAHEETHRFDALNGYKLQADVRELLGGRLNELRQTEGFIEKHTVGAGAADTLESLSDKGTLPGGDPHQTIIEGVADLSQEYIRGHDAFIKSLGPVLDGKGAEAMKLDPSKTLAENFPLTEKLYTYYKQNVFGEKEYTAELINEIKIGTNAAAISELMEGKEGIKLVDNSDSLFQNEANAERLMKLVNFIPSKLYADLDGGTLTVTFGKTEAYGPPGPGELSLKLDPQESLDVPNLSLEAVRIAQTYTDLKNNAEKGVPQQEVTALLGGDMYLASPEGLYPDLAKLKDGTQSEKYLYSIFVNSEGKANEGTAVSLLGGLYVGGWDHFKSLGKVLDPGADMSEPDQYTGTKTFKLYEMVKGLYGGVEYQDTDSHHIPEVKTTGSNVFHP